jgi:hypothetical protein
VFMPETTLETTLRDAAEASRAPRYPGYTRSRPGRIPVTRKQARTPITSPRRPATPSVTKAPPPALTYATMPRAHANTRKPVGITYTRHPMVATSVQTHTAAGGRFIRLGLICRVYWSAVSLRTDGVVRRPIPSWDLQNCNISSREAQINVNKTRGLQFQKRKSQVHSDPASPVNNLKPTD